MSTDDNAAEGGRACKGWERVDEPPHFVILFHCSCKSRKVFFTKTSIDRLRLYVYNIHNFTESDEREASYGSFQRAAGRCEAVRL